MHEFFTPGYSGDTVQLLAGGQKRALAHLNGNKQEDCVCVACTAKAKAQRRSFIWKKTLISVAKARVPERPLCPWGRTFVHLNRNARRVAALEGE